jgi:hypothetical protein
MTPSPRREKALLDLAGSVIRGGRPLRLRVRGGSMTPFIRHGDVVTIAPADPAALRFGDVICFRESPGRLVLHRAIGRRGRNLVAKGDATGSMELVPPGGVLGRAIALERGSRRRRLDTATSRGGNVLLAVLSVSGLVAALLLVALAARRRVRTVLGF